MQKMSLTFIDGFEGSDGEELFCIPDYNLGGRL